jgi:cellulose synthase/poly-beta-1,6-N-acetylglucosamine synthase-like glycosyltransferase
VHSDLGSWLAMVQGPVLLVNSFPGWLRMAVEGLGWAQIAFVVYTLLLSLAGFRRSAPRCLLTPRNSFAIVVPAHDEERVIGCLVDSCLALNYPRQLFDIVVVADNCSDRTAQVARAHGARVIVRYDPRDRSKARALEYAFPRVLMRRRYDAVVVLDADNLIQPDFLRVMNTELLSGHRIIQGRMDAKNAGDTWISAASAMSVWASNRFWFLAKCRLGLSSALGGTGMCIASDVLDSIGWGATSLTEDLEFTMKALAAGIRTYWAHDAVVYDEKPLTFRQSWNQRLRWIRGQAAVAWRYVPVLLLRALRERDVTCLDSVFQLLQPIYAVLGGVMMLVVMLPGRRLLLGPVLGALLFSHTWQIAWSMQYLLTLTLPAIALLLDGGPRRALRFMPLYPLFLYSWIVLAWVGVATCRRKTWLHTQHTRAIAIDDLLGRGSIA